MTHQEILEKAIQKAIDGGWSIPYGVDPKKRGPHWVSGMVNQNLFIWSHDFAKALWGEYKEAHYEKHYIPARGYPGESIPKEQVKMDSKDEADWTCVRCNLKWARCFDARCNLIEKGNIGWEFHLQQMVISDDPIKYLGDHLDDLHIHNGLI